jgi:hypothetical protein
MFATDVILIRRSFASVVPCGFRGVMNLEPAPRRQALRRSASICRRLVLILHQPHVQYIWNPLSVSRRSMSVCEYRVVWRLDAPLGLIFS